ncbi:MAG TPA: hypothetical protein VHD33_03905 [Legionellaceae bacterium]|nr:hypothetical protein [Legionellaceae bacterium]
MSDQEKFNEEEYHFVDDPEMGSFTDTEKIESIEPENNNTSTGDKKTGFMGNVSNYAENMRTKFPGSFNTFLDLLKQNFMLRMTLLVICVLFIAAVIYRCSSNPLGKKIIEKPVAISVTHPHLNKAVTTTPTVRAEMDTKPLVSVEHHISQEKLNELEKNANHLQMQISTLSNQMSGMNSNVTSMMNHLKMMNDQISQLSASLQNQIQVTTELAEKIKQQHTMINKPKISPRPMSINNPVVNYSLQAVIPGRAWLIGTNGETLTVREGSKIINYGTVRYIDAKRGRVLTSSGQVIKFSQEDS